MLDEANTAAYEPRQKVLMGARIITLLLLAFTAGCNPPADYALVGSAYVPAAHGEIETEKIDGGQILVTVVLDHLDPPDKIELGLTHYVVWFIAAGEAPEMQGPLDYDGETRTARGTFPTLLREFDLQITAENSESPERPSDLLVTSQKIREK